jgi:hypothetical protein
MITKPKEPNYITSEKKYEKMLDSKARLPMKVKI